MNIALINLESIFSGDIEAPYLEGDCILVKNGLIEKICTASEIDLNGYKIIDTQGSTAAPGIIDSHVHIVFGDWTPRQNTLGWIESYLHGGITSMMSASEVHLPGRPTDPAGVKALAITAQRAYKNYQPADVKIHAGSIILEPGLSENDFEEVAQEGVRLAKMGFGNFSKNTDAAPLVKYAQNQGMLVMSHTGGVSIPGSHAITADDLLTLNIDIAGHVNGGTTALPEKDLVHLITEADFYFQISQAGNIRSAIKVIEIAIKNNKLPQVLLSSDTPTGTGVMPLGVLKSVVEMATLTALSPGLSWALATGNNADALKQNTGRIAAGKEADIVIMDAPYGSAFNNAHDAIKGGDIPGISAVLIDGNLKVKRSRNTALAQRQIIIHE